MALRSSPEALLNGSMSCPGTAAKLGAFPGCSNQMQLSSQAEGHSVSRGLECRMHPF